MPDLAQQSTVLRSANSRFSVAIAYIIRTGFGTGDRLMPHYRLSRRQCVMTSRLSQALATRNHLLARD
jgi:hypothetical protein